MAELPGDCPRVGAADARGTTWAASMTKGVFAAYVMRLVERREFDLDEPVARQLPRALDEYEPYREKARALVRDPRWGLLTRTRFGPAFFKEGHGDGAQNYMICFELRRACMILLTNSDNGELAFRPLLETILGDTETPWEWEGYTPAYIAKSRTGAP